MLAGQVPGALRGVAQHGAGAGADAVQHADRRDPDEPTRPAAGGARGGAHVGSARGPLQQHDPRQGLSLRATVRARQARSEPQNYS